MSNSLLEEMTDAVRVMKGRDLLALISEATLAAEMPASEALGFFEEMEGALATEVACLRHELSGR